MKIINCDFETIKNGIKKAVSITRETYFMRNKKLRISEEFFIVRGGIKSRSV